MQRRVTNQAVTLSQILHTIPDPRQPSGRRHSLVSVLLIVFIAVLRGSQSLKDAALFARTNQALLHRMNVPLPHGAPDPTTLSRVLGKLDPETLVTAYVTFLATLGISPGDTFSFDGKTMRAATGEGVVRHIVSLFSHETHLVLGQIGVDDKESEIPALERLLEQSRSLGILPGKLLLGDALHTQRATARAILETGADYLFVVKGNQKRLRRAITTTLEGEDSVNRYTYQTTDRNRTMTTTVTVMTAPAAHDTVNLPTGDQQWTGVRTAGILRRTGTRVRKGGTVVSVDETIGIIASRVLTAEEVARHLRAHWCIENNLHWVKDVVLAEDKHTLRRGNAPQVMSFLRSMVISLCHALQLKSLSDTIHNLEKSPRLLGRFLKMAAIV